MSITALKKYYPISPSEIAIHGQGSLIRFSAIITRFNETSDGWVWLLENNDPKIAVYIDNLTLDSNDKLIQELFSKDELKMLFKTIEFLKSVNWRNSPATLYGQTILAVEEWVHFEAHYMLPQIFQSELAKKRLKPTDKIIINKVTQKQAKDFMQRKESLAKLFKGVRSE
jgi:hypothetical protein